MKAVFSSPSVSKLHVISSTSLQCFTRISMKPSPSKLMLVGWPKLSQYSVEDAVDNSCCLSTSSKALSVASRVSIATRVSSAVSRARLKQLREGPYTHAEADRAAGMGSYIAAPKVEVETQPVEEDMDSELLT
ncbi:Zinc finger protein 593 [Liparis tanakae]|uniref:Zinc finger protein 593 n=1 Tax=Liparis tanakae TaxID=230148 RepID=A0A4Z2GNW0_9TELE|nr:Zinc finger protein 593 [Liparis tanakae]